MTTARRLRQPIAPMEALRVLICEDDPVLALELEAIVVECGAVTCGTAASFDEAHDLAGLTAPDLVLVDLHLDDGRSGPRLAAVFAEGGLRIVVISGDSSIDSVLARLDHVFLPKPIQPVMLQGIIAAAIQAKETRDPFAGGAGEPAKSM
ncbi:MAG: response regulator [Phreatobacter sp.]|uniref:response regulator n=1 Tax=Phreatobacter sp. TaxID=1966341 RepID=UPI0027349E16|nr:response regulator [Phreatobacter sp.]MDP2803389.1 response regulator [Phreatobacter sp.]